MKTLKALGLTILAAAFATVVGLALESFMVFMDEVTNNTWSGPLVIAVIGVLMLFGFFRWGVFK